MVMVELGKIVPFSEKSENVSVAIRKRAKEATSDQPSAFRGSVLIGSTDVCSILHESTVVCLVGDTYAVRIADIQNRDCL
jgi:hypothetical protein